MSEISPKNNLIQLFEKDKYDKKCFHNHIIVDDELFEVTCKDCGEKLNPVSVLMRYAKREKNLLFELEREETRFNNISQKLDEKRRTNPGGKGGAGVHQQIINLIPPHNVYIETHLGGGSIMRYKRPAPLNIGIDLDPEVINVWNKTRGLNTKINDDGGSPSGTTSSKLMIDPGELIIKNEDAAVFLKQYKFTGKEFVYLDPPYVMETRKGGKLYDFEYDDNDHVELLNILKSLPCMVMISGYWSRLYMAKLQDWNTHYFQAQTRQGLATEWLWFNYPIPDKLHDYSYIGDTFRDRERIKKKKDRWVARFLKTPIVERNAIIQAILESQQGLSYHQK